MSHVTDDVAVGGIDGESMPLERCVCGKKFEPWNVILGMYPSDPLTMDCCGRQLYFEYSYKVLEVKP